MNEALANPQGIFPNANIYKFYDAKRVMCWVLENFFDICIGYGRPSMSDNINGNIMSPDGSTPSGEHYSVLPYFATVVDPYKIDLGDVTDDDLDFLCQMLLNAARAAEGQRLLGTVDAQDRYVDETAPRYWPHNVVINMKNLINHFYPNAMHRHHHGVMSHSHPLLANLAFDATKDFIGLDTSATATSDSAIAAYFNMTLLKLDEIARLVNDDNLMSKVVLQAMRVAKTDGVLLAGNKDENVGKQIADIVVSSQTALMNTLTKSMAGQGREITLHSNIISQEAYDDRFVCYVNESNPSKTFTVHLENMDSVELWFKDGEDNVIDLNDPEKPVKFRVEMLLESRD
jgi:hypothetical protein